ncbi:MAG: glycosyltransferase family 4 protein, partial [Psychroserpens sp.]|uniref:glycosyltransferase family 4 protein n=1 Tax=Psychroserpens sp. TaxID=2020870 RepID=UPI003CA27B97
QYLHQKWKIENERIHVIPISYGYSLKTNVKSCDFKKLKIISAFRMCWEKNIFSHLKVVAFLRAKLIPVQYDVYGDGPELGQLYYLVDKFNLEDCVTIHGRVDNKDLKMAMKKSDFVLQLSHSESLGLSVIEAQSLGLPAIVSTSGGLPEVIKHNTTGFCVEPDDYKMAAQKLEFLWNDKSKYGEFSKNAILNAQQNFSIQVEVERLALLYLKLMEQN